MTEFPHEDIQEAVTSAMEGLRDGLQGLGVDLRETMGQDLNGEVSVESGDVVERVLQVSIPASLTVKDIAGRVAIRGSDESVIRVKAVKRGTDRARQNTNVEFGIDGNNVTVRTRGLQAKGFFNITGVGQTMSAVEYEISVPRRCALTISTVSADVSLSGTEAGAQAKTVSGNIDISDTTGEISLSTVSGDVTGSNLRGELMMRSTSGDGHFRSCDLPSFNLNSVSGDYTAETPLTRDGHYYAKTTSGNLHLLLPQNTGAVISLKSVSGESSVSGLPVEVIKSGRRNWQGRIGGGGATVEMHTISGDLTVRAASGASTSAPARPAAVTPSPAPAPTPATPPAAAGTSDRADTTRILELLAQGEISVEEAMARMDS